MKIREIIIFTAIIVSVMSQVANAAIEFLTPAQGMVFELEQTMVITWQDDEPDYYVLEVSVNNGRSYYPVNTAGSATSFNWQIPDSIGNTGSKVSMLTDSGYVRIISLSNFSKFSAIRFSTRPGNKLKTKLLDMFRADSSIEQYLNADTVRLIWTRSLNGHFVLPVSNHDYNTHENLIAYSTDRDTQVTVFDSLTNYQHPMFCLDGKRFIFSNNETRKFYIVNWGANNSFSTPRALGYGHAACLWYDTSSGREYVIYTQAADTNSNSLQGNFSVRKMNIDSTAEDYLFFNGDRSMPVNATWMCISADGHTVGNIWQWPDIRTFDVASVPPQQIISDAVAHSSMMPYDYSNRILGVNENHLSWRLFDSRSGAVTELFSPQSLPITSSRIASYSKNVINFISSESVNPGALWICKTDTGFTSVLASVLVDSTLTNAYADLWYNKNPIYLKYLQKRYHTVTYNGNGSTGVVPGTASYQKSDTVTVASGGTLARTGYTFSGWNTMANGTGTSYSAGARFIMGTAPITLYAQWRGMPTYTVTYYGNGNTAGNGPDYASYLTGAVVTVASAGTLARTGYTFSGWNTMSNGTGTSYNVGATFTMGTTTIRLYAQWLPITNSVTYDGNGNTAGIVSDPARYQYGSAVTVASAGTLVKPGYTFSGWNTMANGSGISRMAGSTFMMGSTPITLYAMWTANSYTISYYGNGNTGGTVPYSSSYQYGATLILPNAGTLTKVGYTFTGWNTAANGSGTTYAPGSSFTISSNLTLFAMWTISGPPVITGQPMSLDILAGQSAVFSIAVSGATSFQWKKNGVDIPFANSSIYRIDTVNVSDTGSYSVVVSNSAGLILSNAAKLNIIMGKVAAGSSHSFILKTDGTLWACGYNYYGQLGDGTTTSCTTPVQVMTGVQSMAAGSNHSLILKRDGTLWACGYNSYGQLGDGTTTSRTTPVQVMTGVESVAAGLFHSLVLKRDGSLWACGYNYYGQLGDGTTMSRTTPVQVMTGVESVAAGSFHSLILRNNGTLWASGYNYYGQLGDGTTTSRTTPAQVLTDVQSMAAGSSHSLILKTDGTLWACGYNYSGQLGDGTTTSRTTPVQVMTAVQSMAAGSNHSLILKRDGTLWAYGYNNYGQLGDGTTISSFIPVQVMAGVQSMAAGSNHSLIIKRDGTIWACGYNNYGQLGHGYTNLSPTPIQVSNIDPNNEFPVITSDPRNIIIYEGQSATFRIIATGNNLSYQWQKNGVNIIGANFSSYTTPALVYSDSGSTYRCIVSNSSGSVTSRNATVSVIHPLPPQAAFICNPINGKAPLTVTLTDNSQGIINQWNWDFGDGVTSTQRNPSHTYVNPGNYSVTLTVTGPGGVSTKTLVDAILVRESLSPNLPDLQIASADLQYSQQTNSLVFTIRNAGDASTANVPVSVYRFGELLGSITIPSVAAGGTQPASFTLNGVSNGDYLFRVAIDTGGTITEQDKNNNEASRMITIGQPPAIRGLLQTSCGYSPSTLYPHSSFIVSGHAWYNINTRSTFPVKGADIHATLSDSSGGTSWSFTGAKTNAVGDFSLSFTTPNAPGKLKISLSINDQTFSGICSLYVVVKPLPVDTSREATTPPPPLQTSSGHSGVRVDPIFPKDTVHTAGTIWPTVPDEAKIGGWRCMGDSCLYVSNLNDTTVTRNVPERDLRIYSEDIHFSNPNPDSGESVSICGEYKYWASNTNHSAENVPVRFLVIRPEVDTTVVGSTIIDRIRVDAPDYGSHFVYSNWVNRANGLYIVEAQIDSCYPEDDRRNNSATRALLVGSYQNGYGILSGTVLSTAGGVDSVTIVLTGISDGSIRHALTQKNGFYLFDAVPAGQYRVSCNYGLKYHCDSTSLNIQVTNQKISRADFFLHTLPTPVVDPLPVLSGQAGFVVTSVPVAKDEWGTILRGTTTDPLIFTSPGSFTIDWIYRDSRGNSAMQTQQVVVSGLFAPVLRSPDSASYQHAGNITFRWDPSPEAASYVFQLSNNPEFSEPASSHDVSGTSFMIENFSYSTVYYWRVRAVNGQVKSEWSTSWRFVTVAQTPEPPLRFSPMNYSEGEKLNPVFEFVPLMSAEKYFIQISTSNTNNIDFENNLIFDNYNKPILDGNLGMGAVGIYKFDLETLLSQYKSRGHTHESQLRENQSYYWRIRAESSFNRGGSGPWSVVWEFKKRTVLKPKTMVPMSGQQCVDTTPDLIWHTDDNIPVRYHLQYSGNNASIDTIISSSYFQIQSPLKPKSKYYWRVWAESVEYGTSEMALDSFVTIESRPAAPSLLYPASYPVNRTTGKLLTDGDQPIDVDIRWNNTRPDYDYEMETSEYPGFSVINLPYPEVQPWLTYGKTYYWRVRFVTKDCHVPGEWSNPITFTTKKPVPEFELSNTRIDVEQQSSAQGSIRIVNRSPYAYDLTIFTNSTTSGLEISPSVQNISINALGQADVTLNLTAGNVATGDYYASFRIESREHDAILTNKLRLCVLPAGSLILPDLEIASEDIKTIVDAQGKSTAVSFDLHNRGGSSANDVHYHCFDFDKLISEGSVSAIHRDERHTIEIPIEVDSTGDGNHLIRVLIDPENLIRERDKTNNEASQTFSPQDSGSNFSGGIAINAFIPTVVYSGDGFIISGSANYDITIDGVRYTDYMVKGARVEVSLDGIQANSGHTTADGDFALPFSAPSSPGKYSGRMTVSDRTFTATKQFVITVEPKPSTPPPPSYPVNGTPDGGSWVTDSSGEIKWIPQDGTYKESRNVSIYSEDISFSNDNPSSGDTVSISAVVRSWGSSSALPAQNIPVTLLSTRPGSGATTIGKLLIKNVGPLDSRTVTTSCIFKQDGVYIIEADISSTLQDDNPGDDAATRAIIVGHIRSSSGVASGQVIGPEGGMSGIEIQLYDSTGTTLVFSTLSGDKGTFLFDILQIGTYQVRCIVPSQYTCDTAQRTITIVDQKVTQFNFVFGSKAEEMDTSAPVPVIANLPDIKNQCSARISEIPAAQDNHDGLVIGFTNDPVEYSVQGTYFIRWNFRDSAGNTAFQTQKVVIEDTIAPVPDIMQLPVITGTEMVPVSVTTVPEATDNCIGKIRGTTTQVLTYTNPGTYTITWTYDDGHGNQSNQLQTVVVVPCIKNLTARGKLNQVQLTWTNNGTAPYRIFRSVIGSDRGFVQIATTVSTSSTYLDIGLTPGTTYWYYITSDNSCPSNVVEYVLTGRVIR